MAIEGGTHPEWSKTWMTCYASTTKSGDETHQIAWSWSWTSLAFTFSFKKASMSWSSSAPPASNPGESWNMKQGLLLKENGWRISCIPCYRIGISGRPDKNQIGRLAGTCEVGSSWRQMVDKNTMAFQANSSLSCSFPDHKCKDLWLYCKRAWAASSCWHLPDQ